MKKNLILFLLFFTFAAHARNEPRLELMKYVIEQEKLVPVETEWTTSFWKSLKLIEEAEAYKAGDTCLVLGFKSKFSQGMCRLGKAEGLGDLKSQCFAGSLPCNPQIFGSQNGKPFCVAQNSGQELSRFCAHKSLSAVAKKSKSPDLKKALEVSPKNFDLSQIKFDEASKKEFDSLFSVNSAKDFLKNLCADLKDADKRGHQPLDLAYCEQHLSLFEEKAPKAIEKPIGVKEKAKTEETAEECAQPQAQPAAQIKQQISDVKTIVEKSESDKWMSCLNSLEKHPRVANQLQQFKDLVKAENPRRGHWHNLGGEKNFGMLCLEKNEVKKSETKNFAFLGANGFQLLKSPHDASEKAPNVTKASYKNQTYYLSLDMFGDYFETYSKSEAPKAPSEVRGHIQNYEKDASKSISSLKPAIGSDTDYAKACLKSRFNDYAHWIIADEMDTLVNVDEFNNDLKSLSDPDLKKKYTPTLTEKRAEAFKLLKDKFPSCEGIFEQKDVDGVFSEQTVSLYQKMRGYLNLKDN